MSIDNTVSVRHDEVEFQRLPLSLKDIPRYFDANRLCAQDIIAYVRDKERFPDPNKIVILEANERPVDKDSLVGNRIFYSGPNGNEDEANAFSGLAGVFIPVHVKDLEQSSDSFGIDEFCSRVVEEYGLSDFGILLYGEREDLEDLCKVWQYIQYNSSRTCLVPYYVMDEIMRDKDAIDIAEYIRKASYLEETNNLRHETLMEVIGTIGEKILEAQRQGKDVRISCSMASHSVLTRQIMLYLTLRYNLSPKYVESYIHSYVDGHVIYDHRRMSLYERFMWVRNLPEKFGMFGQSLRMYSFCSPVDGNMYDTGKPTDSEELALTNAFGRYMGKETPAHIYPRPLYAAYVNNTTGRTVVFRPEDGTGDEDLDAAMKTTLTLLEYANYADVLPLVDFRSTFRGSTEYFTDEEPLPSSTMAMATSDSREAMDAETDEKWCEIFIRFAQEVRNKFQETIHPTVKNSVFCTLSQTEILLLYCPGSIGVNCLLTSEYFGHDITIIGEEVFHRFIDLRTLMAMAVKDADQTLALPGGENISFSEIMKQEEKNLRPWIDPEVILVLNTLKPRNSGLSYYDRMLRGTLNVMPIITDKDDPLYEPSVLMEHFTFLDLMSANPMLEGRGSKSLTTLTCFGTLADDISSVPVLQTTLESFRGCELL